jgi:hypothetical protein
MLWHQLFSIRLGRDQFWDVSHVLNAIKPLSSSRLPPILLAGLVHIVKGVRLLPKQLVSHVLNAIKPLSPPSLLAGLVHIVKGVRLLLEHLVDFLLALKDDLEPFVVFANVELNRRNVGLTDKLELRLHEVRRRLVPVHNSDVREIGIVAGFVDLKLDEAVNRAEDDLCTKRHREPKDAG